MNYVHLGCFSFRIDRAGACKESIGEEIENSKRGERNEEKY